MSNFRLLPFFFCGLVFIVWLTPNYCLANPKQGGQQTEKQTKKRALYVSELNKNLSRTQLSLSQYKQKLRQVHQNSLQENDTATLVISLIDLADLDRWKGNFEECFDKLWQAQRIAKQANDTVIQLRIERNLGITYATFNQDSLAATYLFNALDKAKRFCALGYITRKEIVHCYYNIADFYMKNKELNTALLYLDSCEITYGDQRPMPYTNADRGYIYLMQNKIELATTHLRGAHYLLNKQNARYQVVTFSFLGDLKRKLHQTDSAIYYYKKGLEKIEFTQAHADIKPVLCKKLSELYKQQNKCALAYRYLSISQASSDSMFSTIHNRNQKLFLIKNKYQQLAEENELHMQNQQRVIEHKNRLIVLVCLVMASLCLTLALLWLLYRSRNQLKKAALIRQHEIEKNKAVVEAKNKELTSNALKILEKEQAVSELLMALKNTQSSHYHALKNKHIHSSSRLWEDFNLRFLELNQDFYTFLRKKHPSLSPTEQKHCALIKLNFDSKEMAQILNISLQSVHTSRYRIRKKLGLSSTVSLEHYIGEI